MKRKNFLMASAFVVAGGISLVTSAFASKPTLATYQKGTACLAKTSSCTISGTKLCNIPNIYQESTCVTALNFLP